MSEKAKQEGTRAELSNRDETNTDNQLIMVKNKVENFSYSPNCPARLILDRFGDKWSMLVIMLLGVSNEPLRFNEIAHNISDISQKMLTATLRTLEADGLVSRKQYSEIPPRVEYKLTPLAKTLVPHIVNLTAWADTHYEAISRTRKKFENKKMPVG
jgi:DNA-binding HxlR family transcriptional regulator